MEGTLQQRLIEAMAEMVNPRKSETATVPTKGGGKLQYRYETLDSVLAAVRKPLSDHGIGLTQGQLYDAETCSYILQTRVFDAEESMVLDERPIPKCSDAQQSGSWETYMRRYALRTAFGLAGEDDDGAATVGRRPEPQQRKHPSRAVMTRRILELNGDLIRAGYSADELDSIMSSEYGTADISKLTDRQVREHGTRLAELARLAKKEEK